LSSFDFLNFSYNKEIIKEIKRTIDERGFGTTSVRFICGTQDYHIALEKWISEFYFKEDTITYSSGFDANSGMIESLF